VSALHDGIVAVLALLVCASASATELGAPPMLVATPEDYHAHAQNWQVMQGPDGLMHVGNGVGLLSFDGLRWRLTETPHRTRVRRVFAQGDATLLVATTDDLLALSLDRQPWQLRSLATTWPADVRVFGESMGLISNAHGVYLQANHQLLQLAADGSLEQHWQSDAGFQQSFAIGDTLLVQDRERGVLWFGADGSADAPTPLPHTESLVGDQLAQALRLSDGRVLLSMRRAGLQIWTADGLKSFPTEIDAWMRDEIALPIAELDDGGFAIGSIKQGIVRIDREGRLLQRLAEADGLPSNTVYGLGTDAQGGLWAALDGGVVRVGWEQPLSVFDRRHEARTPWGIVRHRGYLLIGNRLGISVQRVDASGRSPHFEQLPGPPRQAWEFLVQGAALWVAGIDGVHVYRDTTGDPAQWRSELTAPARFAYSLAADPMHAGRVYAGTDQGLLRLDGGETSHVVGFDGEVRQLVFDKRGDLYAGTPNARVLRLRAGATALEVISAGLPTGMVWPIAVDDDVWLGTPLGLMRIDGGAARAVAGGCERIGRGLQATDGTLWLQCGERSVRAQRRGDAVAILDYPLATLAEEPGYAFFEDQGVMWVGRERSLVRVEQSQAPRARPTPPPRIVDIVDVERNHTLDAGALWPAGTAHLRFRFALPDFALGASARLATRLDGVDHDWVAVEGDGARAFTNLDGGRYRLHLRAQLADGSERSAELDVAIALPWFRQPLAWALWLLLATAAVYTLGLLMARWRTRRIAASNRELESLVQARTAQLAHQAERLKALDQAKSRFFAAITHDFRTPLTLLIEPVKDLLRGLLGSLPAGAQRELERVDRSAAQLKELVDQILDLSSLQSERPPLRAREHELGRWVGVLVGQFESVARQRGLTLQYARPVQPLEVCFDRRELDKVLLNLLGNALKFTSRGGRIEVSVEALESAARISVSDDGPGIAAADLAQIFDPYFRGSGVLHRLLPGSGLGLAVARSVIERHGGSIRASSEPGHGCRFEVELPLGREHLAARDLASGDEDDAVADASSTAPAVATASPPTLPEDTTTVLIVDDNAELRAFLVERLGRRYRTLQAADGRAALELVRTELPDLIVSDIQMPHMDGLELLRGVRADAETDAIPVLLLGSADSTAVRIGAFEQGADDFLGKPFDTAELAARVAGLLASRRQLRARFGDSAVASASTSAATVDPFLAKVNAVIQQHLGDSGFGVEQLAAAVNRERSSLFKRLKALDQPAPLQLIRDARLNAAAQMLREARGQVTEVAYACGFESLSYFSRSFKERFGQSPSEVARQP
jgi:signal transduction histidine kinase/DNA-binding response OmpR family regulator